MSAHILLFSTTLDWVFPAQLAGAFKELGAHVEVLCPARSLTALSQHPLRFHDYRAFAGLDSLQDAMAAVQPDLVIPCDDQAAELVARSRGDSIPTRMDFLEAAGHAGAPAASSMAIASESDVEKALSKMGLPLVLKADHSWGGEGVAIAATAQDARAAFHRMNNPSRLRDLARALRGRGPHFLTRAITPTAPQISAQAFIAGTCATSSIACWQGELLGAHHFDVVLSSTPTSPASVIEAVPCPQMEASALAIARALNLSGLFGLDYIRDVRGQVHLLEMNARATPTMHLALDEDLPAALMTAAGFSVRHRVPVTDRSEIALFPREWLRDPASPWLTRAFHDVPKDDPKLVRACIQSATVAARALLETPAAPVLTQKVAVFGG